MEEKNGEHSSPLKVIARSRLLERRLLERYMLVPKKLILQKLMGALKNIPLGHFPDLLSYFWAPGNHLRFHRQTWSQCPLCC